MDAQFKNLNLCQLFLALPEISAENIDVLSAHSNDYTLSGNYVITVCFTSQQPFDLAALISKPARLTMLTDKVPVYIHGRIVNTLTAGGIPASIQTIKLASPLHPLIFQDNFRVFLDKNIVEIIEEILTPHFSSTDHYEIRATQRYPKIEHTLQYEESDYVFLTRLLNHWGFYYAFNQSEDKAVLIISDNLENLIAPTTINLSTCIIYRSLENATEQINFTTKSKHLTPGQIISADTNNYCVTEFDFQVNQDLTATVKAVATTVSYRPPHKPYKKHMGFIQAKIESTLHPHSELDEHGSYRIRYFFDESHQLKATASPPIQQLQLSGNDNYGFHFPLKDDMEVLIAFENNDSNKPIIVGILATPKYPSPVNAENVNEHLLQTNGENKLVLNDSLHHENIQVTTAGETVSVLLDARHDQHQIRFIAAQGELKLLAGKALTLTSAESYQHSSGKDYQATIHNNSSILSEHGDIHFQAATDIQLIAQNNALFTAQTGNINLISANNIHLNAGLDSQLKIAGGDLNLTVAQGNLQLVASDSIELQSLGDVIITQGNGRIYFSKEGNVVLQGPKIIIHGDSNILESATTHLGGNGDESHPLPNPFQSQYFIKCAYANGSRCQGLQAQDYKWETSGKNNVSYTNLYGWGTLEIENPSQVDKIVVPHQEIIQVGNTVIPYPYDEITAPFEFKQLVDSQVLEVSCLFPPVIINLAEDLANDSQKQALNDFELEYFSHQQSATLFIHGFNTCLGDFPTKVSEIGDGFIFEDRESRRTVYRDAKMLRQYIPNSSFNDRHQHFTNDEWLNGSGAHNWLLHMEDNLNRAAGKFDRSDYRHYTRLIQIAWPGDVLFYNYMDAVHQANASGIKLVALIQQLLKHNIKINIIAHSLGNAVLLSMMNALGKMGFQDVIEQVFLWQAAIPNDALSSPATNRHAYYHYPHAYKVANRITVLFSQHDDVLGAAPAGDTQYLAKVLDPTEGIVLATLAQTLHAIDEFPLPNHLKSPYNLANLVERPLGNLLQAATSLNHLYHDWIGRYPCNTTGNRFATNLTAQQHFIRTHYPQAFTLLRLVLAKLKGDGLLFGNTRVDEVTTLLITILVSKNAEPAPAMGYSGALIKGMEDNLGKKLKNIDQKNWLISHSGMKIPSDILFKNIYQGILLNIDNGIKNFGLATHGDSPI